MNAHLSSAAARGALAAFVLVVAAYLTYFSIRTARATQYTELQTLYGYEKATKIEPENPRNWHLLGRYLQFSLQDADPTRAEESYKTSLQIDPTQTDVWLDLATAYEAEGNDAEARKAFLAAKRSYPLSAETSWRYGNFLLRQGETANALAEIRQAVAEDPLRAPEAFSRCLRVEPNADAVIDRVLPANTNVYLNVMQGLAREQQAEPALKLWKRIVALRPQVKLQDVSQLVMALTQAGQRQSARTVWFEAADLAGMGNLQAPGNAVWDGGFESNASGLTYSWRFTEQARGVQIGFDRGQKHSGSESLRVTFEGSLNIDFRDVCQTVPVKAGTSYELSGWIRTESLTSDQGVRLEVRGVGAEAVHTTEVHGSQEWSRVAENWVSGADGAEAEVCARRMPSTEEDGKIQGTAWIDDVTLSAAAKAVAKP